MATYYTKQYETCNGVNYQWEQYFTSEESFADNSLVFAHDVELSDKECFKASDESYADCMARIEESLAFDDDDFDEDDAEIDE